MSTEQERILNLRERLAGNLEKARSTGHLLRIAKGILATWSGFSEKAGVASYLHTPWISHGGFLIRSDYLGYNNESLLIAKIIDPKTSEAESVQIVYRGLESEQGFGGVSFVKGKEMTGEEFYDEESGEKSYVGEYSDPLVGEDALPKAKEILRDILNSK